MKIAFIGAGYMTTEHLKAFKDVEGCQLSGIFSRTQSKATELSQSHPGLIVAQSTQELYEQTRAEIVVIAVPELQLAKVCESAFKFPWKVLLEKPAGYDLADAQRILNLAETHGSEVYVALNRRHYSSTRKLVSELEQRTGRRFIHILDQEDQTAALKYGQPELVVKNWMFANSIHLIDYLQFLGRGTISNIEHVIPWNPSEPWHVVAKISYSSGDVALYEAAWNRAGPWSLTVTTNEARYEMRPMETIAVQNYGQRKLEPLAIHAWDTDFKPGLRLQAEELLKAIKGEAHQMPTLKEAFKSMELVAKIYRQN
jgi:predicted dehydrogenase